jgi:hypothetical protein
MEGMVGRMLCASMAAVSGSMAEFAAASTNGYDAAAVAVSAATASLQERGQEEKADNRQHKSEIRHTCS